MTHRHDPGSPECREIFAQLSAYLDEELDPSMCEQIERHNDDCPPCQAFMDSLRRTVELVREKEPMTLPESTRRRIVAECASLRRRLDEADRQDSEGEGS